MGILLTIAYDGTNYAGWQKQKNAVSVSDKLEQCLQRVLLCNFDMLGASRTDAGVHALGQRAHVKLAGECKIPMDALPKVANAVLPRSIRIHAAKWVDDRFHPISDAISKTYEYRICASSLADPRRRKFIWQIYHELDFAAMQAAAAHIVGEYDFAAFCASGHSAKSTVRRINFLRLTQEQSDIVITVNGNGFLYNMVRIIAGTLVEVGEGKIDSAAVSDIIAGKNRAAAGRTSPPNGLTLMEIFY